MILLDIARLLYRLSVLNKRRRAGIFSIEVHCRFMIRPLGVMGAWFPSRDMERWCMQAL